MWTLSFSCLPRGQHTLLGTLLCQPRGTLGGRSPRAGRRGLLGDGWADTAVSGRPSVREESGVRNPKSEEGWHVLPEGTATAPSGRRLALAESPRERVLTAVL